MLVMSEGLHGVGGMQEVIIALLAGILIWGFLNRLMSGIVRHIKDASTEMGTIVCATITQACLSGHLSGNDRTDGKSIKAKSAYIAMISATFTGLIVWYCGVTFFGLAALLCLYFLILLGSIDLKTGYLPDCVTYPFLCTGFIVNIKAVFVPFHIALISAVSAYLVCWTVNGIFRIVSEKDGMGRGDFKMIAALGAWFGWACLIIIVIMASLLAIATSLINRAARRQGFETYFPFGPYLAMAATPVLLYGTRLMQALNDFS